MYTLSIDSLVGARERRVYRASLKLIVDSCNHGICSSDGHEKAYKQHGDMKAPLQFSRQRFFATVTKIKEPKMHWNNDLHSALSISAATHRHRSIRNSTNKANQTAKERYRSTDNESEHSAAYCTSDPSCPMGPAASLKVRRPSQ